MLKRPFSHRLREKILLYISFKSVISASYMIEGVVFSDIPNADPEEEFFCKKKYHFVNLKIYAECRLGVYIFIPQKKKRLTTQY